MLNTLRRRMANEDEGFTLIELMVVVLIIAILMAIAVPTFLGAQDRARDRGAQSNLRNALTAAKTMATDQAGLFIDSGGAALDETDLATAEPSLSFSNGAMTTAGPIDVVTEAAGANIVLYNRSASNTFFCIAATSTGAVTYGKGTAATSVDTLAECAATKW